MSKNNQNYSFLVSQTLVTNLERSFFELLRKFTNDEILINQIITFVIEKYTEKHRVYHNLSHINALLFNAENFRERLADFESVQLAIWFHDVIYNPKRFNNESESAKIAVEYLSKLDVPKVKIEQVERMILATAKHNATDLDFDGKLFLDLDLGILGQNENVYKIYSEAIRKEYSFVPWFLYKRSRRKVLEAFLSREIIYFTQEIRQDFEAQARINLSNEIKELS
jgi:predicted metal-dependent HD superfamily phosphohydrolase